MQSSTAILTDPAGCACARLQPVPRSITNHNATHDAVRSGNCVFLLCPSCEILPNNMQLVDFLSGCRTDLGLSYSHAVAVLLFVLLMSGTWLRALSRLAPGIPRLLSRSLWQDCSCTRDVADGLPHVLVVPSTFTLKADSGICRLLAVLPLLVLNTVAPKLFCRGLDATTVLLVAFDVWWLASFKV